MFEQLSVLQYEHAVNICDKYRRIETTESCTRRRARHPIQITIYISTFKHLMKSSAKKVEKPTTGTAKHFHAMKG